MNRGLIVMAALALASPAVGADAEPPCATCLDPAGANAARPLRIEIESSLQFSRVALRGPEDGEAEMDPQTGARRLAKMIDLGGASWRGRVRITGEPLRPVRIEMPTRVVLHSPDGAEALLTDFTTDLAGATVLDANGNLEFAFGARLSSQGAQGGDFRGRIRIEVDYF